MALRVRRITSSKVQWISKLVQRSTLAFTSFVLAVSSLGVAMPLFLPKEANALSVSTSSRSQGWSAEDGSPVIVSGPTGTDGSGSLKLTTTSDPKQDYYHTANTPLNGINGLGYKLDTTAGVPASYQLKVTNVTGTKGWTTLVWEPVYNGHSSNGPTNGFVDEATLESGVWWSSNAIDGAPNRGTFVPLSTIIAANPNAQIVGYGVGVGSGTPNSTSYVDDISFQSNVTNFELDPLAAVTDLHLVGQGITYNNGDATKKTFNGGSMNLYWTSNTPQSNVTKYSIERTYPGATPQVYTVLPSTHTPLYNFSHEGQGAYTYRVRAENATQHSDWSSPITVTYDTMIPTVSITSPAVGSYIKTDDTVTIKGTSSDGQDGTGISLIWVKIRSGSETGSIVYQNSASVASNGDWTFIVNKSELSNFSTGDALVVQAGSRDGALNDSDLKYASYKVDDTAPTITYRGGPANGATISNNLSSPAHSQRFDINAIDALSGVKSATMHLVDSQGNDILSLAMIPQGVSHPEAWHQYVNAASLANGTYQVWYEATDGVGNVGYLNYDASAGKVSNNYSITIDNTHPTLSFVNYKSYQDIKPLTGNIFSKSQNPTLKVQDNSKVSFELQNDSGTDVKGWDVKTCDVSSQKACYRSFVNLGEGNYKIIATDEAGNSSEQTFTIDNTLPIIDNISLDKTITNGNLLTVSGTVIDNHLDYYRCSVYDSTNKIGLNAELGDTGYYTRYTQNITNGELCTIPIANLASGTYNVRLVAYDEANNVNQNNYTGYTFTVDRNAPAIDNLLLNGKTPKMPVSANGESFDASMVDYVNETVTISADITDTNGSGIAKVYNAKVLALTSNGYTHSNTYSQGFTLTHQSGDTWTGTFDTNDTPADGLYQIFFNTKDTAGNVSSVRINVYVDNTDPTFTVNYPASKVLSESGVIFTGTAQDNGVGLSQANGQDAVYATVYDRTDGTSRTYRPAVDSITHDWTLNATAIDVNKGSNQSLVSYLVSDHKYDVSFKALDKLSNQATANQFSFIYDNAAPNVDAGTDQTVTGKSVGVTGSSNDQNASYSWKQTAGPGTATFGAVGAKGTDVTVDQYGAYTFELTATDAAGNTSSDSVDMTFVQPVDQQAGKGDVTTFTASSDSTHPILPANRLAFTGSSNATSGTASDSAVLGTQTQKDASKTADPASDTAVLGTSDSKDNAGFSLAWYWWALIAAAVIAAIIWIIAAARRRAAQNA